jgi:hypothetical protein
VAPQSYFDCVRGGSRHEYQAPAAATTASNGTNTHFDRKGMMTIVSRDAGVIESSNNRRTELQGIECASIVEIC